jgi:AcrR family transcriptional regulator
MSKFVDSGTGLRERNKLKRRNAILDAALLVLDDEPASSLTVDRVAMVAELSPATVYNLVGGRDDVLRAVVVRIIEHTGNEVQAHAAAGHGRVDALWMSRLAIDLSSAILVKRTVAFRRLVSHMGGLGAGSMVLQGSDGTEHDAPDVHVATMRHAQKKGMIRKSLDPVVLGTLVSNGFNGALLRWSSGGIDDRHLSPMGRLGLVSVAASACTPSHRTGLEREMAALSREIANAPMSANTRPALGAGAADAADNLTIPKSRARP